MKFRKAIIAGAILVASASHAKAVTLANCVRGRDFGTFVEYYCGPKLGVIEVYKSDYGSGKNAKLVADRMWVVSTSEGAVGIAGDDAAAAAEAAADEAAAEASASMGVDSGNDTSSGNGSESDNGGDSIDN